jgi:hypothetical protein
MVGEESKIGERVKEEESNLEERKGREESRVGERVAEESNAAEGVGKGNSNIGEGLEGGEESKVGKNLQGHRTKPKIQWRGPRARTRYLRTVPECR